MKQNQLCVITTNNKFYILDLILNKHELIPYDTKQEAQDIIDNQLNLCELYCK